MPLLQTCQAFVSSKCRFFYILHPLTQCQERLFSVSDKTGLVEFARGLAARGFELVSTGGTANALQQAGLAVVGISDVTGFPEMMDGRVKTLHPLVHGGILARRGRADDLASPTQHGITLIDLVVVNLYPFVQAASNPATPFDGLIEEIDIGGPSLVRAAAKNFQDVLVVVSPTDYAAVLTQLDRGGGPTHGVPLRPGDEGVRAHRQLRHRHRVDARDDHGRCLGVRAPADRGVAAVPHSRAAQGPRSALRREPAPDGGVVR